MQGTPGREQGRNDYRATGGNDRLIDCNESHQVSDEQRELRGDSRVPGATAPVTDGSQRCNQHPAGKREQRSRDESRRRPGQGCESKGADSGRGVVSAVALAALALDTNQ